MEPTPKLNAALAAAQAELPEIPKSKTATVPTKAGGVFSYSYADISDVLSAVRPVLAKQKLCLLQRIEPDQNGSPILITEIRHDSGEMVESRLPLYSGPDDQQLGSSLTYRRRYALCGLLGVAPADDDDGQIGQARQREAPQRKAVRGLQTNRYAGPCVHCSKEVEVECGYFKKDEKGAPKVIHFACYEERTGSPSGETEKAKPREATRLEDVQPKGDGTTTRPASQASFDEVAECKGCGTSIGAAKFCPDCGLGAGEDGPPDSAPTAANGSPGTKTSPDGPKPGRDPVSTGKRGA